MTSYCSHILTFNKKSATSFSIKFVFNIFSVLTQRTKAPTDSKTASNSPLCLSPGITISGISHLLINSRIKSV